MEDLGVADYERGEIWLKKGMSREAKEATLIHEMMHFCNTTINHTTLDSLAEQLYHVLSANKFLK